ncbi:transporter substrate-binding domain-containing protein [Mesorhizobium sp. M00.F.Ca.ET.170.01.1.1]|nr:transporter substrate-binding domain-containing protein [Mesorhizobium sp. M00.F.Ca.ET.170.01.1.1]
MADAVFQIVNLGFKKWGQKMASGQKHLQKIAIALMVCGATISGVFAGVMEDAKQRGKLVCGVQGVTPGFALQNPTTGKIEGLEPELCEKVAHSLGVPVEYKLVASEARIADLLQGRVDLLAAAMTWTAARAEQVDFSAVYFTNYFKVMVRKDSGITNFDGLRTARFANNKGSLLEKITRERFPEATLISYDGNQAYVAIEQKLVDALASGELFLRTFLANADSAKYVILDGDLGYSKIGFAVRKGDPAWVDHLNKVLVDLEKSGEGQKMYDRTIGPIMKERAFKFGDPIN